MERIIEIWQDANGKMSWQRVTASLLLLVIVAQSLFGVAVSKEMVDILKTVLSLQVGAIAASSIGTAIGQGIAEKKPDSPLALPPSTSTPTNPPVTPTGGH